MANPRGNPQNLKPGRRKGSRNKTSVEIANFARQVLESGDYRASLRKRIMAGQAPQIETLLYYYAYGKPIDRIQLLGPMVHEVQRLADLYGMTPEDVLAEAEAIAAGRDG